jgi:membrane associated rhomboid family serine protease
MHGDKGRNFSTKFRNILNRFTPEQVIYTIIGINGAIACYWNTVGGRSRWMMENFSISPIEILNGSDLHTLFTSLFAHHDFMHCFFNMMTLFFFAPEVAAYLGTGKFLQLYLGGGLAASLGVAIYPLVAPLITRQRKGYERTLGASGAVNSVLMYSILLYPKRTILIWGVIPLPAALFGALFIGQDMIGLFDATSVTSHQAHIVGAAFGAMFYFLTKGRGGRGGGFYRRLM